MKVTLLTVVVTLSYVTFAGPAGLVVKGVGKTWDEIAKIALKVSGKSVSDDAVKTAAKTLSAVSEKYGDEVAKAAMHGGIEVAEQTVKHGGVFAKIVSTAGKMSVNGLREIALHADDVMKLIPKYGDDVLRINSKAPGMIARGIPLLEKHGVKDVSRALRALNELPGEDIPLVIGAIEKNPSVAKMFVAHVEKSGKYFVDKVFKLNKEQILAGTLGAAAIVVADDVGNSLNPDPKGPQEVRKIAEEILKNPKALTEDRGWAQKILEEAIPPSLTKGLILGIVIISTGAAACLILLALIKLRRRDMSKREKTVVIAGCMFMVVSCLVGCTPPDVKAYEATIRQLNSRIETMAKEHDTMVANHEAEIKRLTEKISGHEAEVKRYYDEREKRIVKDCDDRVQKLMAKEHDVMVSNHVAEIKRLQEKISGREADVKRYYDEREKRIVKDCDDRVQKLRDDIKNLEAKLSEKDGMILLRNAILWVGAVVFLCGIVLSAVVGCGYRKATRNVLVGDEGGKGDSHDE